MIKIRKPQGGGTVRNIPIKDYQASIAANFGTLRKSVLPQQQFESLVTESEKEPRLSSKTKERVNLLPRISKGNLKIAKRSDDGFSLTMSPDLSLFRSTVAGEYRNNDLPNKDHRRRASVGQNLRDRRGHLERDSVDLQRGHVVQKISVYEGNSRDPIRRSVDTGRKRQLGVPLVGMHNACGLPVIAPWPTQLNVDPVQPSRRIPVTIRPSQKAPLAVPAGRSRTHPKRRAPQHPSEEELAPREPRKFVSRSRQAFIGRNTTVADIGRTSTKQGKGQRRPSFKVNRTDAFSTRLSRDSSVKRSPRTTVRSRKGEVKMRSPLLGTFRRRSLRGGSAKRKTLYAKDDGDEAAKVLSTLCLNPLARGKEAMNMIW